MLSVLLRNPDYILRVASKVTEDDFVTEFNRKIFSVLLSRAKSGRSVDITALNSDFTSEEIGRIAEISSKGAMRANTLEECADCYYIMRQEKLNQSAKKEGFDNDDDFFAAMDRIKKQKVKGVKEDGN